MRTTTFYTIFITILLLYSAGNIYIINRIHKLLPQQYKVFSAIIIAMLAFSFLAGRILERYTVCSTSNFLIWIGALWLGIFVYLFFGFIIADSIRSIASLFFNTIDITKAVYILVIILSACITITGYIIARMPHVKEIHLAIEKPSSINTLRLVFVSDIHLGTIIANSRLQKLVYLLNNSRADIIVFGGDILDEDIKPVIEKNLGQLLLQLKAQYGVIAVLGNHEYIGGVEKAIHYITNHNINILRDEVYTIGDIQIIGRDDRSKQAFTGSERTTLENLLKKTNPNKPVIVIDHQPFLSSKIANHSVDLLLSGHSHHGQLFPFNFITSKLYEVSWGYKKINGTHIYVSSGYGTWGPPIRTNSYPEIIIFNLTFK